MNLLIFTKPYKSSNGHTVTWIGRLFFQVSSASRKNTNHTVDLELADGTPIKDVEYARCDCEDAHYHHARPCRHVLAVFEALEDSIIRKTRGVRVEHEKAQRRVYKLDKSKNLTPKKP